MVPSAETPFAVLFTKLIYSFGKGYDDSGFDAGGRCRVLLLMPKRRVPILRISRRATSKVYLSTITTPNLKPQLCVECLSPVLGCNVGGVVAWFICAFRVEAVKLIVDDARVGHCNGHLADRCSDLRGLKL